ncbi:MAG: DNA-directed RNA polymerase subunit alpha [Deltaproteobacteria bacterium]|nr:DNA-directed RNA polymerase subunit alpha [Deltaproteobacteria bacterium]
MYKNWRELIKPAEVKTDTEALSSTYGKFVVEPMERGFGITVGNALRRVLLSSLQGAAITSYHIDGINHEFSSIPGVHEDVTIVSLNLKGVALKMHTDNPKTLYIDAKGSRNRIVTAADIIVDHEVEILNPEHHIATLEGDATLKMALTAQTGKGYVPAGLISEQHSYPIGTIVLDGVFAPVIKVNYIVTNARVGQQTDYDKLTIEIWTDGSLQPIDALAYSAKIIKEQMSVFINFDEDVEPDEVEAVEVVEKEVVNENLYRNVSELELSVRSANCLKNADIDLIGELVQKSESEMLTTKNFGRKSLLEIKEILTTMGLSLGMKLPDFDPKNAEMIKKVMSDDIEE